MSLREGLQETFRPYEPAFSRNITRNYNGAEYELMMERNDSNEMKCVRIWWEEKYGLVSFVPM